MSLKIISKKPNESTTAFGSRIETETGVTMGWGLGSDGSMFSISKITFSDGSYVDHGSTLISSASVITDWVVLIDDSNHFFALTYGYKMNKGGDVSIGDVLKSYLDIMIVDIDGAPDNIPGVREWYYAFNIPYSAYNNQAAQTIKILPAYVYAYNRKGYSKNLYINYDRAFDTGLKFIDQNGNEFITLGGYLLYKNN